MPTATLLMLVLSYYVINKQKINKLLGIKHEACQSAGELTQHKLKCGLVLAI